MSSRYPEITVAGSPREMGRQLGAAAGERIREFVAVALDRVNLTMRVSRQQAESTAAKSLDYAEAYAPDACDELRGIAEATGLTMMDLMMLQTRNQWQEEPETGCTSFALTATANSAPIIGQNWDNDAGLDPVTIVLTRRPTGKPAFLNVTQAGLIAYIGFSDAGIAVCLNTLPAPSRRLGVPHYFTVRSIYESRSQADAIEAVRRAHRAIPANILLTTPQGPVNLEVTMDAIHLLQPDEQGILTHANHCRHPTLARHNHDHNAYIERVQSWPRQARMDRLMLGKTATSIDSLKAILQDHEGYPRSICRHPTCGPDGSHLQTVFSVIMEPAARRLHLTRGTPCDHGYEVYELHA